MTSLTAVEPASLTVESVTWTMKLDSTASARSPTVLNSSTATRRIVSIRSNLPFKPAEAGARIDFGTIFQPHFPRVAPRGKI